MNRWKKQIGTVLICTLTLTAPIQVWAAGPGAEAPEEYDAPTWAKLNDNTLEYGELPLLIKEFNPMIKYAYDQVDIGIGEVSFSERELRDSASELKEQLKELKAQRALLNGLENDPVYGPQIKKLDAAILQLQTTIPTLDKAASQYKQGIDKMKKPNSSVTKNLRLQVDNITSMAQPLLIAYDNLRTQAVSLQKMKELQQAVYESTALRVSKQMATQTELLAAQKDVASAEAMYMKISNSEAALRKQICLLTGWSADATPDIAPVPAADASRVESIDLAADTIKAIGNNSTLISLRHTGSDQSTASLNNRSMNTDEAEQKLRVEMERLYQDILQKKASYDTAMTAFQKAQMSQKSADLKYQIGSISRIEHMGLQLQYQQAEGNRKAADTALLQAMETYDWAVKGIAEIPN